MHRPLFLLSKLFLGSLAAIVQLPSGYSLETSNYNDIQKSPYYMDSNVYGLNTLEVYLENGITHYLKFDESFLPLKKSIRSHRIKKIK